MEMATEEKKEQERKRGTRESIIALMMGSMLK
jgi:hypothetical protein